VVELVDTLDLGSSAARCESSSLSACTISLSEFFFERFFYWVQQGDFSYLYFLIVLDFENTLKDTCYQ
jgi:hypothetical protein